MDRPRVLLVEDEASIAEPFARALGREGFDAQVAPTAAAARASFDACRPSIVLLDLSLPDGDGRELCREWRRETSVPIIMLTARGTETDRVVGLELGADDYVVKPFSVAEVAARIRAVLRRAQPEPAQAAQPVTLGALRIDPSTRIAPLDGEEVSLTRKEFDLLVLLASHPGRAFSRDFLLERLWGDEYEGFDRTVDSHIVRLRRKLGAAGNRIVTVWGVGYRFST